MAGEARARARRAKRHLWLFSVGVALLPGASALALAATGEPLWSVFSLLVYYGLFPLLDTLVGEDPFNPHKEEIERLSSDRYFDALLFLAVIFLWFSSLASIIVATRMDLPLWAFAAMAASAGVSAGTSILVGHELGHRRGRPEQIAAFFANALPAYGHFRIEHNRGHHAAVATPEDSASARLGESVWAFALREIPGGVARAWRYEAARLSRKDYSAFSLRNEILRSWLVSGAVAGALTLWLGPKALIFLAIHHPIGWLQLTFANYVEHYALKRAKRADGRYEPCAPRHSWNSNHIVSNLMLFHLQRHSDHHANPRQPYQALRHFDEAPRLPSGYPGTFLLAAIPPLWFAVMNPKAREWASGDETRLNRRPGALCAGGVSPRAT